MKFKLIDQIVERGDGRILAVKQVSLAEEYLADHFPTFPVLPGVLMIEAMVQAARALLEAHPDAPSEPLVLGEVRALKFGSMVRPGDALEVEVTLTKAADGEFTCKGVGRVRRGNGGDEPETAVSGRFTLRAVRRG